MQIFTLFKILHLCTQSDLTLRKNVNFLSVTPNVFLQKFSSIAIRRGITIPTKELIPSLSLNSFCFNFYFIQYQAKNAFRISNHWFHYFTSQKCAKLSLRMLDLHVVHLCCNSSDAMDDLKERFALQNFTAYCRTACQMKIGWLQIKFYSNQSQITPQGEATKGHAMSCKVREYLVTGTFNILDN